MVHEYKKKLFAALDVPSETPAGLQLHIFAGDANRTPTVIRIGADDEVKVVERGPGDGTVSRASALMDERLDGQWTPRLRTPIDWTSVRFLFTDHLGLTKDAAFTDNVLYC